MYAIRSYYDIVGVVGRLGIGPFGRIAAEAAVPACSTLMAWGADSADGQLRHARNFDFPGIGVWDQAPEVVFCEPDDRITSYNVCYTKLLRAPVSQRMKLSPTSRPMALVSSLPVLPMRAV